MYQNRCSVRAGIFLHGEGRELLDAITKGQMNTITLDQLTRVAAQMDTQVPNRRTFLAEMRDVAFSDDVLDSELRAMEAVRDAFAKRHSREKRSSGTSVISETTDAGSVFSRSSLHHNVASK